MVVPEPLVGSLKQAQRNMGLRVNIHAQAAYAELIESGALVTHLKRIARLYEERGRLLVQTLRQRLGDSIEIAMPMGGLQTVIGLADHIDDTTVAARLAKEGFETPALSSYCAGEKRKGLVVGFADATEKRMARFAGVLEGLLD
jgi:GntR family transcriptional regulator/MocR family aminotransferase